MVSPLPTTNPPVFYTSQDGGHRELPAPLDPVLPWGPGTHHERVLTVPHEAEASPGEDLRVSVILLDEQPRAVVRGGDTGGTGESHVSATQPPTQPPTATHTQPPTAPGPPQSCCSEGTEACTEWRDGPVLASQPALGPQAAGPSEAAVAGEPSPPGLDWILRAEPHPACLSPSQQPLLCPGQGLPPPPGPQVEGGQALPRWRLPQPLHSPSPLCSPQLLPLWALYPPRPEPDPAGGEPCWAGMYLEPHCSIDDAGTIAGAVGRGSRRRLPCLCNSNYHRRRAFSAGGCQATLDQDICYPTTAHSLGGPSREAVADLPDK